MGRKKPTARDEDDGQPVAAAGKAKKKGYVVADDEYCMGNEILDDASVREENNMAPINNKKKGAPKKSRDEDVDEEVLANDAGEEDEDGDAAVVSVSSKKKSKDKKSSKGSVFASSNFGLLGEDDEEKEDDDERGISAGVDEEPDTSVVEFFGKKKPSKNKKKNVEALSSFNLLEDDDQEVKNLKDVVSEEEEEDVGITFTGKKKKKQKKPSGSAYSLALLDSENNDYDSFSKAGNSLGEGVDLEHEEVDAEINFTGKKKLSRKKNIVQQSTLDVEDADAPTNFVEPDQNVDESKDQIQVVDAVPVASKNKKKKKKAGKPGQEDDDLDKILAEIDGPQVTSKDVSDPIEVAAPLEKKEPDQRGIEEVPAEKNADGEGPAETAAAKKKKKKKEKEKEKKAAASTPAAEEKNEGGKIEATSKVSGMKVPKHVREMQEKLARLKEAEEKKKREEEERLRKEEEERRRQEELERLAEEKKRLKKEREKEKIQKKKQEGTYLTQKERIEARKREMLRNQLLANSAAITLPSGESAGVSAKRPIYQKKKAKPLYQANGSVTSENAESQELNETQLESLLESESVGSENVNKAEPSGANQKIEGDLLVEENGADRQEEEDDADDDEEWDAKSWENADLNLNGTSAFSDEEIDIDPQPIANKTAGLSEKPLAPPRTEHVEIRKKNLDSQGTSITKIQTQVNLEKKSKEAPTKEELPKSDALLKQSGQNLRSPICCIMGHVDTGKTKLLDCIRGTNVQEGEAGGITQQIGATYFPAENIRERTRELKADAKLNVPGLLVIDTPGHESFTNLRSRGSGLCDIAILVVDIMHGLEPQTIESLNLLKLRNTEFIVALNKVDRLYGWKTCRNAPIIKAIKQQSRDVQMEFETRLNEVKTQFMMEGLNTELYYKNKEMGETYNIVPTSAISGEGVPDLLLLLVQWAQKTMTERLTFRNEVECTVLEVKVVEGHGTTIDVVLVNGVLHEGDQIVVCGLQGPIVTSIRALLTPHPMKELRVKGTYLHHKEIKAAQGIKITAQGLEHAVAGTSLYVVGPDDDLEDIKDTAMEDMQSIMSRIDKSGEGVYVQASTLGSLEALLEFLKSPAVKIPVSGISIGPVHKKDVMKASVMLEKKKEYGTILAFDVKVTQEARELADEYGVKIFIADIIYHLFDQFKAYIDDLKEEKKKEAAGDAVFPCVLKIVPGCVFNKKDPIVLGVDVIDGIMKVGTPLCVPQKDFVDIGCISSIENNHKPVDFAKKGEKVAIKVVSTNPEDQKIFGRHFEIEDELVSKISRNSLDALKEHYASELSKDITRLLFTLKKVFKIP